MINWTVGDQRVQSILYEPRWGKDSRLGYGGGSTVWRPGTGFDKVSTLKFIYIKLKKKNPKTHLRTKLIILPSGFYIAIGSYNIPTTIQMNKICIP